MQIYIDYNNVPRDFALFNTALINFKTQFNFLLNQNLHKALQINGVKFYRILQNYFTPNYGIKRGEEMLNIAPHSLLAGIQHLLHYRNHHLRLNAGKAEEVIVVALLVAEE